MFCTNCGSQIPDGSKFCTSCGAQLVNGNVDDGRNKRINVNTGNVSFDVEDVKAATQESFNSILTVLKDPSQSVTLSQGSRIATIIFEMLAHTVFFLLFGLMFKNMIKIIGKMAGMGSYTSYLSDMSFKPSFLWSIIGGIVMVGMLYLYYLLAFAVEEKNFNLAHLDDAIVGAILPSAGMVVTAIAFCIHYYLGMFAAFLTVVTIITTAFSYMPTTNRYIAILYTTVGYAVVIFVFYKIFGQNLANLSVSYQGETYKIKELVSSLDDYF